MCCESCPDYEDCAVKNKLRDDCCRKCPDYSACFGEEGRVNEDEDIDIGEVY